MLNAFEDTDYTLTGTRIVATNEKAQIYFKLFDTRKCISVWDYALDDFNENNLVLLISEKIALSVLDSLEIQLAEKEKEPLIKQPTENLIALAFPEDGISEMKKSNRTRNIR